ncbi:methyltransferase domain-containing protein [Sphaerisporangium sp. TRM90804]|uniref:class I SAM-dependent methyltransferase n=1 Tax=Sphaerisporangium sp. TRM90804 TaxID=3031113 RepID=UPI00244B46AC|nr:methyltransferase domain-containing protein [Sphaerisporangium sp. TRM90804]MDH2427237.1 methyltransferase domain-containing protein [Sphaerisporangium sp. TRM90804]
MIGRKALPAEYREWNAYWGAPYGREEAAALEVADRLEGFDRVDPHAFGPFAFQLTSDTRVFEYPWAYHTMEAKPGMRVLDVGAGLSGLQFVLAMEGCEVTNVDPSAKNGEWGSLSAAMWGLTPHNHQRMNDAFGVDVRLIPETVQDADLPEGTFDRALCLSVLEHLDQADARGILERVAALLAPDGLFLVTVDLFFDVKPFGVLPANSYGGNIDVHQAVSGLGLELVYGDPRELLGFPEFDLERVVELVPDLLVSPRYPCASQALVLRKPAGGAR